MPPRDRSAEAVAMEWCRAHGWSHAAEGDSDRRRIEEVAALLTADRRAERARVRRIVLKEKRQARLLGGTAQTWVTQSCDAILAALREGKGTR